MSKFEVGDYVRVKDTLAAWNGKCGFVVMIGPSNQNVCVGFGSGPTFIGPTFNSIWFFSASLEFATIAEEELVAVLGPDYFS